MAFRIPFNRASLAGRELEYVGQAIAQGHISGNGEFTKRCERLLERELGVPRALLTTSCTHALEMAALLLGLSAEDEVIVPSFTFVSTANAFALRGARPIFADIRPDTLNLDENAVARLLGEKTRAIVPVHYGGVGCEMGIISRLASERGIAVVEDNAHGFMGRYKGGLLGTFGALATLSFHETKNVTCGEGGALLINDPALVERAEILREKGTDRSRFMRGQVDKYTWMSLGSSYVPSDILAAFLLAQLEAVESIQERRKKLWLRYYDLLADWAHERGVRLPVVPAHCAQAYHLFHLLAPTPSVRDAIIEHLKAAGILSVFHYVPLHLSPMGRSLGGKPGSCPVAEDVGRRLLRLPFYSSMTQVDQDEVAARVKSTRW